MAKRNPINLTADDTELNKAGAQRLLEEDIWVDLMTLKSWKEICDGRAEPIDKLLEMIEEDKRSGEELINSMLTS